MNPDHLATMANQIGAFFETMPDRQQASFDIASHLKRFWTPGMRRALLQQASGGQGVPLSNIVQEALQLHRTMIM